MSDGRSTVLGSVRRALGRGPDESTPPATMTERLARHPRGPAPAFSDDLARVFLQRLEAAAGTFERAETLADVAGVVARYLDGQGLPLRAVISGEKPRFEGLAWPEGSVVEQRAATEADAVAVVSAFAGVAETGSLVLLSGPRSPTSLNFLPDHFIAVLPQHRILPHLEDVWHALRTQTAGLPRAVNLVTGPSRTADVEQTLQMGAHGPRKVHVILVET